MPDQRQKQLIVAATAYIVNVVTLAAMLYASPLYWKQDYHTSKLTGAAWVEELINGHPDRIWTELGVRLHVFLILVHELRTICGLKDERHVGANEQVAMFLYMCVTGLSVRHVGERFQRSNETISKSVNTNGLKSLICLIDNYQILPSSSVCCVIWFILQKICPASSRSYSRLHPKRPKILAIFPECNWCN
jgi:hypothetical protein